MGACASKFSVLKNSADAPPPAPKEELASREVKLVEETVVEKDDEAKHQSLGHLFKENEREKGSAENNGNASEEVKQDNEDVKFSKSEKAEDGTPASENVETETKKIEEKPVEAVKLETGEKVGKPEENKPVEVPCIEEKPETPEMEKTEGQKPASDAEKEKEEEKPTETETLEKKPETPENEKTETSEKKPETLENEKTEEQKPDSDAEKKKVEEKTIEDIKIETSDRVEDRHVLGAPKTEPPLDKKQDEESTTKPETPEMSSEEQKPALDAEKPIAEEGKTMK